MAKHIGRIRRNESEEIRVSLQEVHGELHVELRVYGRSARQGGPYLPEPESIVVPVHVVADLCRALEETHDLLIKQGLVRLPSLTDVIDMEAGDPVTLQLVDPVTLQAVDQRAAPSVPRAEARVPERLPVECHLLAAPDTWPSKSLPAQVTGEIRIMNSQVAQVWLPQEFPVSTHLAVFISAGELNFRGKAEVAAAASHPMGGSYQHTFRWLSLSPQSEAALLKLANAPQ